MAYENVKGWISSYSYEFDNDELKDEIRSDPSDVSGKYDKFVKNQIITEEENRPKSTRGEKAFPTFKKIVSNKLDVDQLNPKNKPSFLDFNKLAGRLLGVESQRKAVRSKTETWDWDSTPLSVKRQIINNDGEVTKNFARVWGFEEGHGDDVRLDLAGAGSLWDSLFSQAANQAGISTSDLKNLNWSGYQKVKEEATE